MRALQNMQRKIVTENIRLFIGFKLPDDILELILRVQKSYKRAFPGLRLIKKENLHSTLLFLGACPREKTGLILDKLKSAQKILPLTIKLDGLLYLPSPENARVFSVKLTDPERRLNRLYSMLYNEIRDLGIDLETREFLPHISFARRRKPITVTIPPAAEVIRHVRFELNKLSLFQSVLYQTGAEYIALN